jgi:hypothetical protein
MKLSSAQKLNQFLHAEKNSEIGSSDGFKVHDFNDLLSYIRVDELVNLFCQSHCSTVLPSLLLQRTDSSPVGPLRLKKNLASNVHWEF